MISKNVKFCWFFSQLLSKPKFSVLEKIKTIGSTYMVAAGLQPGKEGEPRAAVSRIKLKKDKNNSKAKRQAQKY